MSSPDTTHLEQAAAGPAGSWLPQAAIVLGLLLLLAHAETSRPPDALHQIRPPAAQDPSRVPGQGRDVQIEVDGRATGADQEAVRWARDRFREAELALPARLRVTFHDGREPCAGAQGGFTIEEGVSRVLVCVPRSENSNELRIRRTLLHEFAHAWDRVALTDRVRADFTRFRGSDGWLEESGVPYAERAGEHAAETITWGLMDEPFLMGTLSAPWTWEELHDGYVVLTGREPPHGYVWSLFAVTPSHRTYAHTPSQLDVAERAWEQAEQRENGRRPERVQIRFHRDPGSCGGAATQSEQVDGRLQVRACPAPPSVLAQGLLQELTDTRPPWASSGRAVPPLDRRLPPR